MLLLKRIISIQVVLITVLIGLIISKSDKGIIKRDSVLDTISYEIDKANSDNYYGRLYIEKIQLNEGFYNINDIRNNVDKGIELLNPSIMPDKENSKLFLASHSGNSDVSYFKNINKLEYSDEVLIYFNNNCYRYKVIDKYEIIKNGTLNIKEIEDKSLVLITCVRDTNRQLVVVCKLI